MENEITVSYNVLRDSHRRLVNALREAKDREALLCERITKAYAQPDMFVPAP